MPKKQTLTLKDKGLQMFLERFIGGNHRDNHLDAMQMANTCFHGADETAEDHARRVDMFAAITGAEVTAAERQIVLAGLQSDQVYLKFLKAHFRDPIRLARYLVRRFSKVTWQETAR